MTKQNNALRLAEQYDYGDPAAHSNTWKVAVCTELRRQHARIAELEARIKTMAEEHADELMVAHLDGRMQAEQPAPQQEAASVDLKTMELAESVGLIGPASRTHDLHAAIQRFHDLICVDATIKAAQMAAEVISAAAPKQEAQEPVAWQSRTRPTWGGNTRPWSPWEPCTKEQAEDCWKTPLLHDWAYEARALFTAPQPSPTPQADSQPAPQQEPVAWYVTGCGRLLDEDEAKAEARHIGGTARAIPLYTAPQPSPQADSVLEDAGGANWQDISTAPKDGTRFVAVGQNYGLDSEGQHTCIAQWFRGCWIEVSEWNEISELIYLTHWMPLPPLPGNAARKQGENHD